MSRPLRTLFLLAVLIGCSDFGSDPYQGWIEYVLYDGEISVPPGLQLKSLFCDPAPCNPLRDGTYRGARIVVEYHIGRRD